MTDPHEHAAPTDPSPSQSLPPGWVETNLGEATGYGSTSKAEPHEIPADAWVLELEDIEKDTSRILSHLSFAQRDSKSTKNKFLAGDVLYGKLRPYLNKVVMANKDGFCTTEIIPIRQQEYTDSRFVFYWLKHPDFLKYVTTVSHGMNMPRLGTEAGQQAPFLLAPLPEQIRIADKLDALLARVDAGRERLARVPGLLARLRQSILSAAVSGELTREWRGGGDAEWEEVTGKEVFSFITSGSRGWAEYYSNEGSIFLRIGNLEHYNIALDLRNIQYVNPPQGAEGSRTRVQVDDILISITADVGMVAHINSDIGEAYINQHICLTRPKPENLPRYLAYFLTAPNGGLAHLRNIQRGATKVGLTLSDIRETNFALPPLSEQAEIVRRVEALFAIADRLEARYAAALAAFDRLTPALLQKAFRGELVPQDPSDEPAAVLLERIRAAREAAGEKPRRGRGGGQPKRSAATPEPGEGKRRGRPRKTDTADSEAEARAMLKARKAAREVAFQDAPQGDRMPELFGE